MKVPKFYEGKLVGMSLVRAVHAFEYGAHVKMGNSELLAPAPIMKQIPGPPGEAPKQSASMTDMLMGALVVTAGDDSVTVDLFIPDSDNLGGVVMRKTIPNELVLSVDAVEQYDAPMPTVTQQVRQKQDDKPRIILGG